MAGGQSIPMPEFMLKAVGFESEDAMLPGPVMSTAATVFSRSFSATPTVFCFSMPVAFRHCQTG